MNPTAKRAAIYCRVSRDEQAGNWSLPTQEDACRKHAEQHGYDIVGVWREDFSGLKIDRPEMDKVRKLVEDRQVDVVLCYKVDRLTRDNNYGLGWFMTEFRRHGADGEFVIDPPGNTPEGQIIAGLRAFAGNQEVREIRERTTRGLRAKAKSGKAIGRARPQFGLRYVPPTFDGDGKPVKGTVNAAYEPDPATIDALKLMFQQADDGVSLRGITKGLDELAVRPPYADRTGSTRWNPASIHHILTSPNYIGEGVQFAVKVIDHPDPRFKKKRVRVAIDPDGDGAIPVPAGVYPAVIDRSQFERVQRRLAQNRRESQRSDRNPEFGILRRGIARCGHCNSSLVVNYNGGKNAVGKSAVYGCQGVQRARHGCPRCDITALKLDREVWAWIVAIRDNPHLVEAFAARLRSGKDKEAESANMLAMLDGRISETESRRDRLTKRLAIVDDDTAVLVAEELRRLAGERQGLLSQRETIRVASEADDQRRLRIQRATDTVVGIADPGCDLDALSYQEKRRILLDLGAVIHVYPHGHRPRWGMTLAFDNDRSRVHVIGDGEGAIVWDDDQWETRDDDDASFYLYSPRPYATSRG